MKSRTPCSTLFALKASLLTLLTLAGLSAASLWADTVYVQCGISTYYNGYSDSAPSHTSSTGGFAGTATYKSTATGMVSDGGRYCAGGASVDSLPWIKLQPGNMNTAANNNETQSGTGVALVNAGGVYALSLTRGSDSSVNTDVTMGITAANATLSASTTTAFKSGTANAVNNWASVCTVYCNSGHASDVTVTFTYHSGTTYRIVGNGFKFDYLGQPISFSTQPAGTASATAGGSVSIGPVATTGPLGGTTTYQWKKNGVNVSGAEYSGGTGTTLTINPATTGDSGTYTCVATSTT